MSDLLAAASAALGIPEALVERSAAARAAESGASVDEVLAAWAGDGTVIPDSPPDQDEVDVEMEAAQSTTPSDDEAVPSPVVEIPSAPLTPEAPVHVTEDGLPPTLIGASDNPLRVFAGSIALFVAIFLVGFVGPSLAFDEPGARTTDIAYSDSAEHGQDLYQSQGCAACHTQMIRPVTADVGLGPVSLNDSDQVLGLRRFGPDLADVGSRLTTEDLILIIEGARGHTDLALAQQDLTDLVAYLSESKTGGSS